MSLNYGITCYNDDGDEITSPAALAALYAGDVTCSITSGTQTFDFPNVPAGALYAMMVATGSKYSGGTHDWVVTSSAGHARIVFTFVDLDFRASASTTLRLFASNTFEPDYGINATNEDGERTISTIYPACKFIQKLTLSSVLDNYQGFTGASTKYELESTTTAAATGMLLWSLPSTSDTSTYWSGATNVAAGAKAKMFLYQTGTTAPSVRPEAFLFQTGPMTVSTQWGIRVFNGAGEVMFDGSTESMKIEARITNVSYTSTDISYTLPSGYTPAIYMPGYVRESRQGACLDGYATTEHERGLFRRTGTTLFARRRTMAFDEEGWDCRRDDGTRDYEWGMPSGLFVPVINANRYGGAVI